ncbi:MAG: alpha/beta fold hydrolase [Thermobispora bispora]|nr:alpha/beta fold hydrolase [Thermobispora bispora]MDI9580703.1 alpha/beta hydrolase [Thermobispora sp.]
MRQVLAVVAGAAALIAGSAVPAGARPAPGRGIAWRPCDRTLTARPPLGIGIRAAREDPGGKRAGRALQEECATVQVPLDHSRPDGRQITLAINRIRGTAPRNGEHRGVLLVNPGGPGGSGLELARHVAALLPPEVAARYDVIGFDPRGVGASRPALTCVDARRYFAAPRPDNVPRTAAEEDALVARAKRYAEACGERWGWFLPHLHTENAARDMDVIRAALGKEKISYLGYSYGTYLGAVYATLFPHRVHRLVLDSVVDPGRVWYDSNLDQNHGFDRRHRDFLAWVARYHAEYRLGRTEAAVSRAWYALRDRLRTRPAAGIIGPSELDDIYTAGAYSSRLWPALAGAFSWYVHRGETAGLVRLHRALGKEDEEEENSYAVYLGVECRDAPWPRDWARWHRDTVRSHEDAPFMAWPNTVYNAPCAFWPVPGRTPVRVGTDRLPPVLLIQSEGDPATPYPGALTVRRLFPTARLVVESGGGDHGVSLGGNPCVDDRLAAYLLDGRVPERRSTGHADAVCPAPPAPEPAAAEDGDRRP